MTAQFTAKSELSLKDVKDSSNNFHHYFAGYLTLSIIIIAGFFNSRSSIITIPILEVKLPTEFFYILAPLSHALLHAIVLTKFERLASKVNNFFNTICDGSCPTEHTRLWYYLPGNLFIQWLSGNYLKKGKRPEEWFSTFVIGMFLLSFPTTLYWMLSISPNSHVSDWFVILPAFGTLGFSAYIACRIHQKHKKTVNTRNRNSHPQDSLKHRSGFVKLSQLLIVSVLSSFCLFSGLGVIDKTFSKDCPLYHMWPKLNDKQTKDLRDLCEW